MHFQMKPYSISLQLYAVIDCKLNSDLTSITSVCVTDTNTLTVTVGEYCNHGNHGNHL